MIWEILFTILLSWRKIGLELCRYTSAGLSADHKKAPMAPLFTLIITLIDPLRAYLEMAVFVALLAVVIYLFYQLGKKRYFIRSILEKLNIRDQKSTQEELLRVLSKLRMFEFGKAITRDEFFNDQIINYIFEDKEERKVFLHYTREEEVAQSILKEGFRFKYSFYKTADKVFKDKLYLIYKHNHNKYFGKYVVVISFSRETYELYAKKMKKIALPGTAVEQVLTEVQPFLDEDEEVVYTLSNHFLKGYFNYEDGTIIDNPDFDPGYRSPVFDQNLEKIKKSGN